MSKKMIVLLVVGAFLAILARNMIVYMTGPEREFDRVVRLYGDELCPPGYWPDMGAEPSVCRDLSGTRAALPTADRALCAAAGDEAPDYCPE